MPMPQTLAVLFLLVWQGADYRLRIRPVDFQDENRPETFIKHIIQLETDGTDLYVSAAGNPYLLQISPRGEFIRTIGRAGQGPGELGSYTPSAMSVSGQSIWVHANGRANYFEKGDYVTGFKLPRLHSRSPTGRIQFTSDRDHILLAVPPTTGHLAAVYDYGGEHKMFVGDIIPINEDLYSRNPFLNETLWDRDEEFWYCLFHYRPILRKFDRTFRLVAEFKLTGPEIDLREEDFFERKNLNVTINGFRMNFPHFSGFKVFGSHLFLECKSTLYQIDKNTGETLSRTHFFGKGPEFELTTPGKPLGFHEMAFLPPNRFFFGDGWEHDLWTAELPFLNLR